MWICIIFPGDNGFKHHKRKSSPNLTLCLTCARLHLLSLHPKCIVIKRRFSRCKKCKSLESISERINWKAINFIRNFNGILEKPSKIWMCKINWFGIFLSNLQMHSLICTFSPMRNLSSCGNQRYYKGSFSKSVVTWPKTTKVHFVWCYFLFFPLWKKRRNFNQNSICPFLWRKQVHPKSAFSLFQRPLPSRIGKAV